MTTLFISDLHLDDGRPESTALFEQFVDEEAMRSDALYILGDLFEYWIGDDAPTATSKRVTTALTALGNAGVPCFFMHGNRDFLLGEEFARESSLTLLPQEHVINLYGKQVLLLHGDTLCTDDVAYQKVRQEVRSDKWQNWFLAQTVDQRIAFALEAREDSREHQSNLSMEIMDVNPGAVCRIFEQYGVREMIHGHTHRPAVHEHMISGGEARRYVLGDWYEQGSVIRADADGLRLDRYPFNGPAATLLT